MNQENDIQPKYTKNQLLLAGIIVVMLIAYLIYFGPQLFQPRLLSHKIISKNSKDIGKHYIKVIVDTYEPPYPELRELCWHICKNNYSKDYKALFIQIYTPDMDTNSRPYARAKYTNTSTVYSYYGRK